MSHRPDRSDRASPPVMVRRLAWLPAILGALVAGCIDVNVKPIEVKPIYIVVDLNVRRVDGPATTQATTGPTVTLDDVFAATRAATRAVEMPAPNAR